MQKACITGSRFRVVFIYQFSITYCMILKKKGSIARWVFVWFFIQCNEKSCSDPASHTGGFSVPKNPEKKPEKLRGETQCLVGGKFWGGGVGGILPNRNRIRGPFDPANNGVVLKKKKEKLQGVFVGIKNMQKN